MVSEFLKRQKQDLIRDISALGSLLCYVLVMAVFLMIGNYKLFVKMFLGLIVIYLITIIIRSFYFKERPKKYTYSSFIDKLDASSFPSLHSSRIGYLSLLLMDFLNNKFFSILLITIVLLVAVSRVYLKKHTKADVVAGLVIGVIIYFLVNNIIWVN